MIIQNFLQSTDMIGTAGQPFQDQFKQIHSADYQVVINLAMPNSFDAIPDEANIVHALGMEYIHIPVVWEAPQRSDLEQFFQVIEKLQGKKLFIHCARNMRVSVFLYLYRVLRLKMPEEDCMADVLKIWEPNEIWKNFINNMLHDHE
jgi:protein tyrosine phosphatase (PTP) superfamily phosphohydrolase (DUF442 family)